MRFLLAVVGVVAFLSVGCGPTNDSQSCQNAAASFCTTINVTGAEITTKSCPDGTTLVSSCPSSGIAARCAINSIAATCPSGATCSTTIYFLTGADLTQGEMVCTQAGGAWSTN